MAISIFHLFSIGIGPSSSHTVGPMRAASRFSELCESDNLLDDACTIKIDLYGSLALTGKGHGTDLAVLLGLEGEHPESVDPNSIEPRMEQIKASKIINFCGKKRVPYVLIFHKDKQLPFHPNGMRISLISKEENDLISKTYYSIGGGFILSHEEVVEDRHLGEDNHSIPFPYRTAAELVHHCEEQSKSIEQIVMENEKTWRSEQEVRTEALKIWSVMQECTKRGCQNEGILPGGLKVHRRAAALLRNLERRKKEGRVHPAQVMQWVSLWALAVNEENAAGGRVVTAPTNGAAGVIPSVLHYYLNFTENPSDDGIISFLLTAGAVGILYKVGASISAAEMGCMGEVGVACSMAAAGLTAALGGSISQIENAAEIGMEHNLGLTCDPVMGLVQIPCIERNTMGAVKAINASLLALEGEGYFRVSLDQVIKTMRQTGKDMQSMYKETSLGGLAVNVPEC
jgi:L-serine dehydratase